MAALDRTVVTNSAAPRPLGRYSLGMSINPRKLVYVAGQGVWTPTETRWGEATRRHRHVKRLRISVSCWRAPVPISAMLSSSLPTSSPVPPSQGVPRRLGRTLSAFVSIRRLPAQHPARGGGHGARRLSGRDKGCGGVAVGYSKRYAPEAHIGRPRTIG